jgi:hypothetical protein
VSASPSFLSSSSLLGCNRHLPFLVPRRPNAHAPCVPCSVPTPPPSAGTLCLVAWTGIRLQPNNKKRRREEDIEIEREEREGERVERACSCAFCVTVPPFPHTVPRDYGPTGPSLLSRYPSVLGPAYAVPLSLGPLSSIPYTPLRIRRVNNPIKKKKKKKEKKEREREKREMRRERFHVYVPRSHPRTSGQRALGR